MPLGRCTFRLLLLALLASGGAGPSTRDVSPLASASVAARARDRPANRAEAESAYGAAVRQLRAAESEVVRARQQAASDYRAAPEYAAAARDLLTTFDAYDERLNGLLLSAEQHDPRYANFKRGVADVDADLARAGQNPAETPEEYAELLEKRLALTAQLKAMEEDVVGRSPDGKQLRQKWADASARLDALRARQSTFVEQQPTVRAAIAAAAVSRTAVDQARAQLPAAPPVDPADANPPADDLVRRYPRHALGGDDAWLMSAGGK